MPSSFVDARTSYARSTASAAQGKIIGELAEEYQRSASYRTAKRQTRGPSASEASAAEKRRAKQQAKIAKMNAKITEKERANFAKGGAATDTIPALLTPGEFVFNAKAQQKVLVMLILNRMNKRGVQGFAKGGPVGFENGGPVPGFPAPQPFDPKTAGALDELIKKAEKAAQVTDKNNKTTEKK
jgi:hypothetical protein